MMKNKSLYILSKKRGDETQAADKIFDLLVTGDTSFQLLMLVMAMFVKPPKLRPYPCIMSARAEGNGVGWATK
jgi:hypothetical protein